MRVTTRSLAPAAAVAAALLAAGCPKAGLGPEVRTDVQTRMESARPALTECYAKALRDDRKLRGLIVLRIVAAPGTGAFSEVEVLRDDLQSPALRECVLATVGALALSTPQQSKVSVTYPLDFAPTR